MIDLQSFNQSLKIKWIKGYLDENNQGKWKSFFDYYLEKHGGKLVISGDLKREDIALLNISDPFLLEILEHLIKLQRQELKFRFLSNLA